MPRSILLVDDHEVIRRQLRLLFNSHPEFTICGEAGHGGEAIEGVVAQVMVGQRPIERDIVPREGVLALRLELALVGIVMDILKPDQPAR